MAHTGQKCETSGIYRSNCHKGHSEEIALSVGETFPPCSHCKGSATWTLIRPTHN